MKTSMSWQLLTETLAWSGSLMRLSRKIPGLLLLTATPQQLGPEGHFARLRLLDSNRYNT